MFRGKKSKEDWSGVSDHRKFISRLKLTKLCTIYSYYKSFINLLSLFTELQEKEEEHPGYRL